jgi:hypothetical protein
MAQMRSRRIEPKAPPKPAQSRRFPVEWVALAVVLLAGGIPFAIGKYTEFNMPGPFDSGAYVYAAEAMLQGRQLGTDLMISAQPATLLVNLAGVWLFGFNEIGPKLIQMLMQLAALAMMYRTLRRLYGLPAAVVGASVAAIYLSAPLIAKYGNVKEQYMISVMVMGICCYVWYRLNGGWWRAALAGALLINAFYFKATGVSAGVAVFGFLVLQMAMRKRSPGSFGRDYGLLLAGACLGVIPLGIFYAVQDRMNMFYGTLPWVVLKLVVTVSVLAAVGVGLIGLVRRYHLIQPLRQVRRGFWIIGAILIVIATGLALGIVYHKGSSIGPEDAWDAVDSYVWNHPFVNYPWRVWERVEKIWDQLVWMVTGRGNYVGASRAVWSFEKQIPIVFRYYSALKLPVLLALLSIGTAATAWVAGRKKRAVPIAEPSFEDRVRSVGAEAALLFAIWWLLDMSFVWISPRSFEEYYLPLNASAAMTGGYLLGWYRDKFQAAAFKIPWLTGGMVAGFVALIMVWPIFGGLSVSPYSGKPYERPSRGYVQRLEEVRQRKQNQPPWERVAQVIREQSQPSDEIFVWGWYPGIYVQAQRLSPVPKAYESEMHVINPVFLSQEVIWILQGFARQMPAFIVDSRKSEFPWDRRPLELWPTLQDGRLIPNQPAAIAEYDAAYRKFLLNSVGEDEMLRYDAMEPLRKFVREHYEIVNDRSFTPQHILFRLKPGGSSTPGPRMP